VNVASPKRARLTMRIARAINPTVIVEVLSEATERYDGKVVA
jgi:hypothetical protein